MLPGGSGGLTIGVRYTTLHAMYSATAYQPGDIPMDGAPPNYNTPTHRIGPLIAFSLWEARHRRINGPTVFVLAQWWLDHRYRAGQQVNQAIPYLVIGLSFRGDLIK